MLWDGSSRSWLELGVRGQPTAILFAADGTRLKTWAGLFDLDEVLRLIGE